MPKQKYDWTALHDEFLNSEYDEVKSFLNAKWMRWKVSNKYINGRAKDKQKAKKKALAGATEKTIKKMTKDLEMPVEKLMEWKKAILWLLLQQVKKYMDDSRNERGEIVKDIDIANAERILRMFKTELWEPSTIGTNYNLNANKNEWLTEDELEALDLLFWKSQNWKKSKQQ